MPTETKMLFFIYLLFLGGGVLSIYGLNVHSNFPPCPVCCPQHTLEGVESLHEILVEVRLELHETWLYDVTVVHMAS